MDRKTKTEGADDRRASDRRVVQRPFKGGNKRVDERRTGADRRTAPRT